MDNEINKIKEENIRTEYAALTSYGNQVVSFRFTLVSFYIAAIGLIMSGEPSKTKLWLLLWISITLWLLELRNRGGVRGSNLHCSQDAIVEKNGDSIFY